MFIFVPEVSIFIFYCVG